MYLYAHDITSEERAERRLPFFCIKNARRKHGGDAKGAGLPTQHEPCFLHAHIYFIRNRVNFQPTFVYKACYFLEIFGKKRETDAAAPPHRTISMTLPNGMAQPSAVRMRLFALSTLAILPQYVW